MRAQVIDREAVERQIIDEYGDQWDVIADAGDGTLALQLSGEHTNPMQAGIFRYDLNRPMDGELWVGKDGDTYGINSSEEYVIENGVWRHT